MRDILRAEECPSEIIDAIGGWKSAGVGNSYGDQLPLEVKHKWMNKIILFMNQSQLIIEAQKNVRRNLMFVSSDDFKTKKKKRTKWQDSWITYTIFIGVVWIVNFNFIISLGS